MKKENVRTRIVNTASYLFYNQGYNLTGINQIIEEAGIAKASLYQHFRSKEDVAVEYLTQRHGIWMNALVQTINTGQNPKEKILKLFDYLMEWLPKDNFVGCAFLNMLAEIPEDNVKLHQIILDHKNELRLLFKTVLLELKKADEVKAEKTSNQILVIIEGAIVQTKLQKAIWPIESSKEIASLILEKL